MAIYTLRSGGTAHPEASVLQTLTDLVNQSGVYNAMGADFEVVEQAVPDLTVLVGMGKAYIRGASTYPIRATADETLAIAANSSGNPRIDAVVLYVDLSETANADSSNVVKLFDVVGTPAASPVAPTNGDISTAIGASNPFIRLANVTVASGATLILDANITDTRPQFYTYIYTEGWVDLTDGATINVDLNLGRKFRVTIAGNRTFTLSNLTSGKTFVVRVKQDGVGSRTVTWWGSLSWPDGIAPTLTLTANKADELVFNCLDTTNTEGFVVGQNV